MKKIFFIIIITSICSFGLVKRRAPIPQSSTILNSDVVFLGKVSKIDTSGFFVAVQKMVINNSLNKKILATKDLFISVPNAKKNRYSYYQIPKLGATQFFLTKYDSKFKTLRLTDYNSGLIIDENDSTYITGNNVVKLFKKNEVIEAIQLLHKCYSFKKEYFDNGVLKPKATQTEVKNAKKSSPIAKIWIDEIETRNENYLKNR